MHNGNDCHVCGQVHVMGFLVNDIDNNQNSIKKRIARVWNLFADFCFAALPFSLLAIVVVLLMMVGRTQ